MKKQLILPATLFILLAFASCETENALEDINAPENIIETANSTITFETLLDDFGLEGISTIKIGDTVLDFNENISTTEAEELYSILDNAPHLVAQTDLGTILVMDHILDEKEISILGKENDGAQRKWSHPIGYSITISRASTESFTWNGTAPRGATGAAHHATKAFSVGSKFISLGRRVDYSLRRKISRKTNYLGIRLQKVASHGGGFSTFKWVQVVNGSSSSTRRCEKLLNGGNNISNGVTRIVLEYTHQNTDCSN